MKQKRANVAAIVLIIFSLTALLFGCATQTAPKQSSQPQAAAPLAVIKSVAASNTADGVRVTVTADHPLVFSSLKQPDPLAVVLYFPQTKVEQGGVKQPKGIGLISRIATRQQNGGRTARVEIQLAKDAAYSAAKEGNSVAIQFKPAETAAAKPAAPAASTGAPLAAMTSKAAAAPAAQAKPAKPGKISAAKAKAPAWVDKIDFLSGKDGKSTLSIGTTHAVNYRIVKKSPKHIEIRLLDTRIPSYRQRPLITTRFNSAVNRIIPVQPNKHKNESIISIELRQAVPFLTEQVDNLLLVHFEPSTIPPKPLEQADLPDWKRVLSEEQNEPLPAAPAGGKVAAEPAAPRPSVQPVTQGDDQNGAGLEADIAKGDAAIQSLLYPTQKKYTGQKIALDFYETDIKNVFRILQAVSGKNFAIDKDVTGKVTMTLDHPVPYDQVLDLVLRMNNLGMIQDGNIIRIATQATLKKEAAIRQAKIEAYRKALKEAQSLEPMVTKYIPVNYCNAKTDIEPHIQKILTKGRGTVSVDEKNNQIIITDTAAKVEQAEEIVHRIDKVTSQVLIEARIVEVNDTFSRQLGITWNASFGPDTFGNWSATTNVAMNFPSGATNTIGINFARLTGVPFVLDAKLDALESLSEGRILSAPKILTLDNTKARIKQGVQYPYLERDSSGGSSVKFKNIDLLLEVTPHVTPDNRISMLIYITKNDVAGLTNGVPSVSTNEARTQLLINNGDTIVIGGIIKSTVNTGTDGFPGLSKIPLLGWLFKDRTSNKQRQELLIFITPHIVQLKQAATQPTSEIGANSVNDDNSDLSE